MGIQASPADQALLLDLQDADNRLRQLVYKRANLPERARMAELDDALVPLDRAVLDALGTVDDATAEINRVEADIAVVNERTKRDEVLLQSTSDPKTATSLEHELASLAKRRSDLEDIELAVMERQEAAEAVLADARTAAEASRSERDALQTAIRASEAELDGQRDEAESLRGAIAAKVPADLLALYERQRERYGIGASLLQRGISGASGVQLTATDLAKVRAAAPEDVLLCPDSSAILVRTEESGL